MSVIAQDPDVVEARRNVRINRSEFQKSTAGKFARTMMAAMREFEKMRGEGVPFDDAVKGIEAVLRASWPGKTTKFEACPSCQNTGWRLTTCQYGARCGRERICGNSPPSWEHPYVVPCDCSLGDKFRPVVRSAEEALTAVGRAKKGKGWKKLSGTSA